MKRQKLWTSWFIDLSKYFVHAADQWKDPFLVFPVLNRRPLHGHCSRPKILFLSRGLPRSGRGFLSIHFRHRSLGNRPTGGGGLKTDSPPRVVRVGIGAAQARMWVKSKRARGLQEQSASTPCPTSSRCPFFLTWAGRIIIESREIMGKEREREKKERPSPHKSEDKTQILWRTTFSSLLFPHCKLHIWTWKVFGRAIIKSFFCAFMAKSLYCTLWRIEFGISSIFLAAG